MGQRDCAMRLFCGVVLVLATCGFSCVTTNDPPTVKPVPVVIIEGDDGCSAACERGRHLGCAYAETEDGDDDVMGTADDMSCEELCRYMAATGLPFDVACYAAAESCEQADLCQEGASVPEDGEL